METTNTQQNTTSGKAFTGSSTLGTQAEFPLLANQFPPRAAVVSKRPRGRPSGPRGFVFRIWGAGALQALRQAEAYHGYARRASVFALTARRQNGPRDAAGHASAIVGRSTLHFAFACVLAARLRLQGGAL